MANSGDKPSSEDKNSSEDKEESESIFEVLDELIFHMNTTKNLFLLLVISSFVLAPMALIMGAVIAVNPKFLHTISIKAPEAGVVILAFIIISVILASIWLFIGIKERTFFAQWDKKFKRYISLKDQIDKELREEE